jgi:hypothetical protein
MVSIFLTSLFLRNTDEIHSSASGLKHQHHQARKMLRDTRHHSMQVPNDAASLSRRTSTPKPSEATQKRFLFTTIHLYDAAPSRSLLIRNKISALDSLSTFGAKRACLERKTPGRNMFVSFTANRSGELSGRWTEEQPVFREHRLHLIARPLFLRSPRGRYHLIARSEAPALYTAVITTTKSLFSFPHPETFSLPFFSRLSGHPAPQIPGGRGNWRIASNWRTEPSSTLFFPFI